MTQWSHLLENLGIWEGSFTRLSPQGKLREDVPSQVSLERLNNSTTVRQTIRFFAADRQTLKQEKVLEYSSLSRSVLVFDSGAFSQGSMQYGPFAAFGAELGLKQENCRLRLVQQYDQQAQLDAITLIREHLQGTGSMQRPPLTMSHEQGEWRGTAVTLYPSLSPPDYTETHCVMEQQGARVRYQSTLGLLSQGIGAEIASETFEFELTTSDSGSSNPGATAPMGQTERFSQHSVIGDRWISTTAQPAVQWLNLADGCFSLCPVAVPRQQGFSLQVGWHTGDRQRQRLLRHYDHTGAWVALTWVNEQR